MRLSNHEKSCMKKKANNPCLPSCQPTLPGKRKKHFPQLYHVGLVLFLTQKEKGAQTVDIIQHLVFILLGGQPWSTFLCQNIQA